MGRVSWYRHMSMAIWEAFLGDEEQGWTRVQKGTLYDVDGDSDSEVQHKVLQAAWKATGPGRMPQGWS